MKYQQNKQQSGRGGFGQNAQFQRGRFNAGQRPVSGQIISVDDKSITVKLRDGSSKIIILSDKTTITKSTNGAKDDLKTDAQVVIFGTTNSDGSITADTVSLNTMFSGIEITPKDR
ncbi:MAG: hypothetical protein Q7R51_02800 [bacterium]|nr:hypothetical protein [bacterium]